MSTCGACGCVDLDALAKQIDAQEFDHCFQVVDGQVRDAPRDVYAPSVFHDDDDDIMIDDYRGQWRCFTGLTGQYGYSGAVMHPSEFVGTNVARVIAEHAAEHPSAVFALVTVEVLPEDVPDHDCPWDPNRTPQPLGAPFCSVCDEHDDEPEPAGWAIAYRD